MFEYRHLQFCVILIVLTVPALRTTSVSAHKDLLEIDAKSQVRDKWMSTYAAAIMNVIGSVSDFLS